MHCSRHTAYRARRSIKRRPRCPNGHRSLLPLGGRAWQTNLFLPTSAEILADTFVGFRLDPWRESKKRKAVATAKFYFFDVGVATLHPDSADFRAAFEHFIAMELRSYLSYRRGKKDFTFWRTQRGAEVDFLIGTEFSTGDTS